MIIDVLAKDSVCDRDLMRRFFENLAVTAAWIPLIVHD